MTEPAAAVRAARERIRGTIVRTPLVRLPLDRQPDVWLKLENLQPVSSFKLRGAANAVACLMESGDAAVSAGPSLHPDWRRDGVWTISAGNAGQGVAFAARQAGIACKVLVIETAPDTKVAAMRRLGAELVMAPFEVCWKALEERSYPGMEGVFVHPFDDDDFIAGNGTMGLEIAEDLPGVRTVIGAFGGGGLVVGVAHGLAAASSEARVWGAEPESAAPAARSFAAGSPQWFPEWRATFVDGAGGKCVFPPMWERVRAAGVAGSIVVTLDQARDAMRLVAERLRVICEGAAACAVAAALTLPASEGPVVAIVSGGNIDLARFSELVSG